MRDNLHFVGLHQTPEKGTLYPDTLVAVFVDATNGAAYSNYELGEPLIYSAIGLTAATVEKGMSDRKVSLYFTEDLIDEARQAFLGREEGAQYPVIEVEQIKAARDNIKPGSKWEYTGPLYVM